MPSSKSYGDGEYWHEKRQRGSRRCRHGRPMSETSAIQRISSARRRGGRAVGVRACDTACRGHREVDVRHRSIR